MATTRSFSDMLNQYLPNELLYEELVKRDYVLNKVKKDNSWKGGDLIVPFEGNMASSISFGALTASTDVAEWDFVRGSITTQKEVWGTLLFNHRDLMEHDGRIPESTFLKILPGQIDKFINYMKEAVSVQLISGPQFAAFVADTDLANGVVEVDRIDRFSLGQKVKVDDDNTTPSEYYVIAININLSTVTLSATRGGAAANVSSFTTAQNAKFYHPGVEVDGSTSFLSMKSALLSSANGGASTLHGQTKTAYPYLQAVNISGSAITAANILDKLFDAYVDVRKKARGRASTFLMSYKHWGSVMKVLQDEKGGFQVTKDPNASLYGWTEVQIASTKTGDNLTIVGIQEAPDSEIYLIDWDSLCFYSNGFFKKRVSPDGDSYYEVRATTGYSYLVDICCFGEMAFLKPSNNAVIYSIAY